MTKKISLILVLTLILALFAACDQSTSITETVTFEDGSYIVVALQDTYTVPQCSNTAQEGVQLQPLSNYVHFWPNLPYDSSQYPDWVQREDGTPAIIWRDRSGNMLYNTTYVTKKCSYYSADHRLLWTMSVTAMFKENSIDSYCEIVSSNITVWETDSWYVLGESNQASQDTVFYSVHFGRKNLGVTIAEPTYTMELRRDPMGFFH